MNIDAIRQIPLVDFLNHLGYQPTGRDSKGLWFYSPYRNERKPSFHVNPRKNLWFDFGSGAGGDIFTLAGELTGETDFIRRAEFIAQKMQLPVEKPYKPVPFVEEPTFENVEISRLESPILLNYLADRGIPRDIAQRYCVQVDYTLHGKRYYAVGFENNAHGYELRNPFFKGAYPPKNITHIANGNPRCNVFEGFIDFLSAEILGYMTVTTAWYSTPCQISTRQYLICNTIRLCYAISTMMLPDVQHSPDYNVSLATRWRINPHSILNTRI